MCAFLYGKAHRVGGNQTNFAGNRGPGAPIILSRRFSRRLYFETLDSAMLRKTLVMLSAPLSER